MNTDIYTQLKGKPEYAKYLYRYGFLITASEESKAYIKSHKDGALIPGSSYKASLVISLRYGDA